MCVMCIEYDIIKNVVINSYDSKLMPNFFLKV